MNWHQINAGMYGLQMGYFFPKNKNVMFRKEVILRKKNGDAPSATLLIRNSTIRNLQKPQRT